MDAVRPDSETARDFATLMDRMDRAQIRIWLTRWRDNDALLQPTLEKSALLKEDAPVSQALSRAASIGLQALGYLDRKERPADTWLAQQRAFLETIEKPQAELRIAIMPSIEKLVNAAASPSVPPAP